MTEEKASSRLLAQVKDTEGHLWARGEDGLYRLDPGGRIPLTLDEVDSRYGPVDVAPKPWGRVRDADGDVWELGEDGLYRLKGYLQHEGRTLDNLSVNYGPVTPA